MNEYELGKDVMELESRLNLLSTDLRNMVNVIQNQGEEMKALRRQIARLSAKKEE